jgi:hypothetical protein
LAHIRKKTGADPARLRQLSTHLEENQNQSSDFRARSIHHRTLVYDSGDTDADE